ncbi:MAG: hypothetical protein WBW62_06065, partial [Solirubrobacterales bacterium]
MTFVSYLAGTAGLLLGLVFAAVPAVLLQRRLLPGWSGPVAWTGILVLLVAVLVFSGLLLGTVRLLEGWTFLIFLGLLAGGSWYFRSYFEPPGEGSGLASIPAGKLLTWAGFGVAAIAFGAFSVAVRLKLGTGMTGFDSTWYHGPFAAGFSQSGDTFSLHYL